MRTLSSDPIFPAQKKTTWKSMRCPTSKGGLVTPSETAMYSFHHISALFLLSLVYILPLMRVSTARQTVEPPSEGLAIPHPPLSQGVWTPRSHRRNGGNIPALPRRLDASMIEQRTNPRLSSAKVQMRMVTFKTVVAMAPFTDAARFLETFYSSIAINAAGAWQALPQRNAFRIFEGPFALSFTCVGDSIPWSFVKDMADRLWECACLGMSQLFEAVFMTDARDIAVAVSLTLMEGDGSSQSSSTDYREGSVPSVGSPYD